jgi:hypothetical protein
MKLNQQLRRIEITAFKIDKFIVFNNLNNEEGYDKLLRSNYIGVFAVKEDRFSSFLFKISNELVTKLKTLKMIFKIMHVLFNKTTKRGIMVEEDVSESLNKFFKTKKWKDVVVLTGNEPGLSQKNKTGDILWLSKVEIQNLRWNVNSIKA